RAKGLTDNKIMRRYVLRNALLPQMTQLAMVLGNIFGGALLTEMLFTYPGIGTLMYSAISNSDFNLMMGIATLSVTAVATAGLLIDFIYPFIDPRIRYK
ncbi:MAG TPA: ABC transporter permease, partial [Thermotogaceae bacterium]|nr:ABC transporter permease [Thermotogaceae bacterium]